MNVSLMAPTLNFMKKVEKVTHTPLLCSSVYVYEYLEYEVYGVALAARE